MYICLQDKERTPMMAYIVRSCVRTWRWYSSWTKDLATRGNEPTLTSVAFAHHQCQDRKKEETNCRRKTSLLHQENVIFSCNRGNRGTKKHSSLPF